MDDVLKYLHNFQWIKNKEGENEETSVNLLVVAEKTLSTIE